MKKNGKVRIVLFSILCIIGLFGIYIYCAVQSIPDSLALNSGQSKEVDFLLPCRVDADDQAASAVTINGERLCDVRDHMLVSAQIAAEDSAEMEVALFGIFPVKSIALQVDDTAKTVIPGGQSIGVTLHTQGVLIVGISKVIDETGNVSMPAKDAGLQAGDVITAVNGTVIEDAGHFAEMINEMDGTIELTVKRNEKTFFAQVKPVMDAYDHLSRLGVWVRDSTAGVGTLTFFDPQSGQFAGLGHAITDLDTGKTLSVKDGKIISSEIVEIVRGESGLAGELHGEFSVNENVLGEIQKNNGFGIFGTMTTDITNPLYPDGIEIGTRENVHDGEASILCTVDNSGIKAFTCRISEVEKQDTPQQKSFLVTVTDKELLEKTNGIVQGMSGSPIIQDGKLIGAVTHVFVQEPQKGYGVYIEWMLNELTVS